MKGASMKYVVSYRGMACGAEDNCSGHGECLNGTCICEIQFVGEECTATNTSYFAVFATIFFAVAFVCLVQLVASIVAEWHRMKRPSVLRACRITTQKLLYLVVFLASIIRGAYFTSPNTFEDGWSRSLMTAFYPLVLSGSSLIVCFWAEMFHIRDLRWEHRQFLSKSFLAFVTFNVMSYSLLLGEFLTHNIFEVDQELRSFYTVVFNCCYAVMLFIVVVAFLFYGVEVYFKLRGEFLLDGNETVRRPDESAELFENGKKRRKTDNPTIVDVSQLHQSRLGLLSQAIFLTAIIFFLCSDTLKYYWKDKVPVSGRNLLDVLFRAAEIGVALWFPCVLWNCLRPEQLWILNPKKLIKNKTKVKCRKSSKIASRHSEADDGQDDGLDDYEEDEADGGLECWICYDSTRTDAGPIIEPCQCKGDVRTVHHDCLKKWLMESRDLLCPVCRTRYGVTTSPSSKAFSPSSCKKAAYLFFNSTTTITACSTTVPILTLAAIAVILAALVVQRASNNVAKVLAVGCALLVVYVCVKFLCEKQLEMYHKAKVSSITILDQTDGHKSEENSLIGQQQPQSIQSEACLKQNLTTISETVAVPTQL